MPIMSTESSNGCAKHSRRKFPIWLLSRMSLCEYTSHGHCGVVHGNEIVNDASIELLAKKKRWHMHRPVRILWAPSDMFDGRVKAIPEYLDAKQVSQHSDYIVLGKICIRFYGPFREAAESAPKFGDRRSHQMDPANSDEALHEVEQTSSRVRISSW